MNKLLSVLLMIGLLVSLFFAVFEDGIIPSIVDKGENVENQINTRN